MSKTHFHFDHVGSYLRPNELKQARADLDAGKISAAELLTTQHQLVDDLVDNEVKSGLHVITDGEFGRSWWHLDFLWNLNGIEAYDQAASYAFHGAKTRATNVRINGKLSANFDHPFFNDFSYLKSIAPDGVEVKTTIPAPTLLFRDGRSDLALNFYDTWEDYLTDLAKTYHDTLQHYYDLGSRYVQLDDTTWAFLIAKLNESKDDPIAHAKYEKIAQDGVWVINEALKDLPEDLRVATHICRGNFKSTYLFEGGYAPVAKYLGSLNYDTFFLEYDDERSGDFAPLADIWNGRENVELVLGLLTSKSPDLETVEDVKARIEAAAQIVPLQNLGISTQCGFSSTEEGNVLTIAQQWDKLKRVGEVATAVWGD